MQLASLFAVGVLAATASAQQTLVTPNNHASLEGNSNNSYPWNRGGQSTRIQFVYDATNFTAQSVSFPILISKLRFRAENAPTSTTWPGGTWPNVRIDMASCPVDYLAVSTTFANNLGPDVTTVQDGPVIVSPGAGAGTTVPGPWYITIPLTRSFVYDPSAGSDLVVDIHQDGEGWIGQSTQADHASGATPSPALGSRVYNATAGALTATTGGINVDYAAVAEFTYVPANGLFANFATSVVGGTSPLAVDFTNTSFSSDPAGVTSFAWDFDGDSVIDSTLPNPSFVYTSCGNYTVSLTVTDASHPPSTLTRTSYIRTDRVVASFASQLVAPLLVQFTDTTTPAATSWAWDLDGDNIVDSTAQNPTWLYANTNAVSVTLTATRLCGPPSTVSRPVIPVQQLTTSLVATGNAGMPATVYGNLVVHNPLGISLDAFDSISPTVSSPFTVELYLKNNGFAGHELDAAAWTRVATASGTSNAIANQPSHATLAQPLYLPPGSYGVAMHYVGISPGYLPTGAAHTNSDLSIAFGSSSLSPAGAFTGTNVDSPRMWCGTLFYSTNDVTNLAAYGWFGEGCASTLGRTSIVATSQPTIGGTLTLDLDNLPLGSAVMILGLSNTVSGGAVWLPFELSFVGAPGCSLRVSLDATAAVVGVAPNASWSLAIPANPALMGFVAFNQAAVLDPGANAFGFAFSHAYGWVLGN